MMTHDGGSRPDAVVRWIGLSIATRPYPAYRDSGVHGLGRVPKHWEVRRVKHSLAVNVAVLPEDTEPEYEFRYIDIGSVGTGELISDPKSLRFETAPSRARRVVGRGDTLVSTVRTYLKAVWHAEEDIRDLVASTGFAVLTPRPFSRFNGLRRVDPEARRVVGRGDTLVSTVRTYLKAVWHAEEDIRDLVASTGFAVLTPTPFSRPWILPKFVGYVCRSEPFTDHLTAESAGVVYPAIAETRLASALRLCIPPLPEQRAIARFLDYADRRIQRYIRAKERLIKLLEEQKQAIIHQAVTGQIDVRTGQPYPAYKDSGVEWLGEVPEHWVVSRLGRLVDLTVGFPFKSESFTQSGGDMRLLRGVNIAPGGLRWDKVVRWPAEGVGSFAEYRMEVGDIVVGMDRPIIRGGTRVAVTSPSDVPSLLLQRVARIRVGERLHRDFAVALLSGKGFADYLAPIFTGISVPHLSPEQIKGFRLALPSVVEQDAIMEHVKSKSDAIQSAIDGAKKEIGLLHEYRTRLIADVVTGKLDVREAAAPLLGIDPAGAEGTLREPAQRIAEPKAAIPHPHP